MSKATKKKAIKVTLDGRDYGRFCQVMKDMNIEKSAILAKKFVLDGVKKYRIEHPQLVTEERLLAGRGPEPGNDEQNPGPARDTKIV